MLEAMESAVAGSDYLLGERFLMADVIFGGTLRFLLQFEMIELRPPFVAYVERMSARLALQRAETRSPAEAAERGLDR